MSKKIMKRGLALGALMAFVITGSAMAGEVSGKYLQLKGDPETIDSIQTIVDSTPRVLGGWYNANGDDSNAEKTASTETTSFTISGDEWHMAVGGHYADKSTYAITSNLESTSMLIEGEETYVYQVVGGSVASGATQVAYNNTQNTNLTIENGTFGRDPSRTNTPENIVVAGDLLKWGYAQGGNLASSIGTTKLTIEGGDFYSVIIGGSAAVKYYSSNTTDRITANVTNANIVINGGTFNKPIVAGGLATGQINVSTVETANLIISGADNHLKFGDEADIFSGGVYDNYSVKDGNAAVGVANVEIDNATVNNIYGYAMKWEFIEDNSIPIKPDASNNSDIEGIWTGANNHKDEFTVLTDKHVNTKLTLTKVTANTVEIPVGTVTLKAEKTTDKTTISNLKVANKDQVSLIGTKELHEALTGDANEKATTFVEMFEVKSTTNLSEIDTTLEESKVDGQIDIDVKHDSTTGKFTVQDVTEQVNISNEGIVNMANIGLISWRAETNDMNKRLGELRNANGEHGVWVRMVRGEDEYGNVKHQYNQYQLGYDEKLSTDKRWTVGAAINYTDAETSFSRGNGESTNKALSIYGSKLNDDGTFVDLIAKYARLENDFTASGGMREADYGTNAYSFSAEAGKRIQQGKGLWIEPQVELTYGKVANANYVSENGVRFAQDSIDSLVGRIGFSLGKDIKQGNVYARASYLYDFEGDTKINVTDIATGKTKDFKDDLGGGWWEVGVGANFNLSDATYIYADVEKTFGGEVDTNWQWNLGVRYSF